MTDTIRKRAAEVARRKDGWLEGYPLLWCEKPFTFVRFDPAWPRAICKRPDNSECAIDIRTATPISTAAHRKRTVNRAAETANKLKCIVCSMTGTKAKNMRRRCANRYEVKNLMIESGHCRFEATEADQ